MLLVLLLCSNLFSSLLFPFSDSWHFFSVSFSLFGATWPSNFDLWHHFGCTKEHSILPKSASGKQLISEVKGPLPTPSTNQAMGKILSSDPVQLWLLWVNDCNDFDLLSKCHCQAPSLPFGSCILADLLLKWHTADGKSELFRAECKAITLFSTFYNYRPLNPLSISRKAYPSKAYLSICLYL